MVELRRRLELVGLSAEVLDLYPIELSGGMKQRVVMVVSSLLDPSLLIADEITSALDVSTQKAVAKALVEFRDRGFVKSMIVITHGPLGAVPDRRHDPRHVRRAAGREGPTEDDHRLVGTPLYAAADLVPAGGRRHLRDQQAERDPRHARRRC